MQHRRSRRAQADQPRAGSPPLRHARRGQPVMRTPCDEVSDELAELVAGDPDAIARHADHLAGCDDCRDARHDAAQLAALVAAAGADHVERGDLADRVLAALDGSATAPTQAMPATTATFVGPAPAPTPKAAAAPSPASAPIAATNAVAGAPAERAAPVHAPAPRAS